MNINRDTIYEEKVTSPRTELLFVVLAILFFLLFIWRANTGLDALAIVLCCVFCMFLFYSVNYRTLIIRLSSECLKLKFGIFTWRVHLDNIDECLHDDNIPTLMRLGGAGIHFMMVRKRYRASFNFLEHPRVVISFKRKAGLVRDISFSTRQPNDVIRYVQDTISSKTKELL